MLRTYVTKEFNSSMKKRDRHYSVVRRNIQTLSAPVTKELN